MIPTIGGVLTRHILCGCAPPGEHHGGRDLLFLDPVPELGAVQAEQTESFVRPHAAPVAARPG